MAEQLHPQQPSHDGTMRKKCNLRDYKSRREKPPNHNSIDIPMQTSKALFVDAVIEGLFVANSKLSTNAHLFRICPKDFDGRRRYVLFFKIKGEIRMS